MLQSFKGGLTLYVYLYILLSWIYKLKRINQYLSFFIVFFFLIDRLKYRDCIWIYEKLVRGRIFVFFAQCLGRGSECVGLLNAPKLNVTIWT